jgi:RimJ/RimL family protein N-acetyltransferase
MTMGAEHVTNEFEGRLVRLRAPEPDDLDTWREFDLDSEGNRRWGATHLPVSRETMKRRSEERSEQSTIPTDDRIRLAIETLAGQVVGSLSVGMADRRNGVFDYGIAIGHQHRSKGFGSEAVVLLLRFYFAELGYQKCDTGIYAFNEGSLRFHERFGFVVEGRRRRNVYTLAQYFDVILVGMTREEFGDRHGLIPKS